MKKEYYIEISDQWFDTLIWMTIASIVMIVIGVLA